jgi:hypothetical protein
VGLQKSARCLLPLILDYFLCPDVRVSFLQRKVLEHLDAGFSAYKFSELYVSNPHAMYVRPDSCVVDIPDGVVEGSVQGCVLSEWRLA